MRTLFGNFNNDNYNQDINDDDDHKHNENISYVDFLFIGVSVSVVIIIIFFIKIVYKKYNLQIVAEEKKNTIELEGELYNPIKDYIPEQCIICISTFEVDEKITTLECGHSYHHECITEWYHKNQTCPICK
tara:strand:+ start:381 stop:773 length:393 start_codon:yes stop_codon:yes gene_type:complete